MTDLKRTLHEIKIVDNHYTIVKFIRTCNNVQGLYENLTVCVESTWKCAVLYNRFHLIIGPIAPKEEPKSHTEDKELIRDDGIETKGLLEKRRVKPQNTKTLKNLLQYATDESPLKRNTACFPGLVSIEKESLLFKSLILQSLVPITAYHLDL